MKTLHDMRISYEPIPSDAAKLFTKKEWELYAALFKKVETVRLKKEMRLLCKQIEEFLSQSPHLSMLANLLASVYIRLKERKKMELLVEESYERYPDYFFARMNYADLCLRRGKVEKVGQIFQHRSNLSELFPGKTLFHFCEVRGFYTLMGHYHLASDNRLEAERCWNIAREVEPRHPSVLYLQERLFPISLVRRIKNRIARIFRIR